MIIEGAKVFNVYRKRFEAKAVLLREGLIRDVADEVPSPPGEERIDAAGRYLVPGLVDIHMHIESSMTVPREFSRAVLPLGTTTVVSDPHEIANVFGVQGIRAFMDQDTDLDIFYGIPSSVPSTNSQLETTGGSISSEDAALLAADSRVLCLGEVMNAADLIRAEDTPTKRLLRKFREVQPRCPIEGHCPKISGEELSAFIASGVWADHTHQSPASMLEKIDKGMFIELQRKSITLENIRTVVEENLFEHVCLATDDVMPDRLLSGHLNSLVALAIKMGMRPEDAIYCATYVPSRHMMLSDRGAIAPGRIADFILLDDLESFSINAVYKAGRRVAGLAATRNAQRAPSFPPAFYTSVQRKPLVLDDFIIRVPAGYAESIIDCTCISIEPRSTFTEQHSVPCAVSDGLIDWQSAGLSLICAIERYGHQAPLRFGFVQGALKREGAVATTWAHDHHNLLVMGTSIQDLLYLANTLIAGQGGYAVAQGGLIIAHAPLKVGGIVDDGPIEELAANIQAVRKAMQDLGYEHADEIMSFSTLSLLVSPRLKISDKGLIDVKTQTLVESYAPHHP